MNNADSLNLYSWKKVQAWAKLLSLGYSSAVLYDSALKRLT